MPLLVLLIVALAAGLSVGLVTWRYPRRSQSVRTPALATAEKVGETARGQAGVRRALGRRLNPESATGLALSLALLFVVVAGVVLGLLAFLVRTNARLNAIDRSVAKWGDRNASAAIDARAERGYAARIDLRRDRPVRRPRARRAAPDGRKMDRPVHRPGRRRRGGGIDGDQGHRRPGASDIQPGSCDTRPIVPERSHDDRRGVLCRRRPASRPAASPRGSRRDHGRSGRDRRRGRRESCAPRRPLAHGRDRRPGSRLGLVCHLRHRLRRSPAPVRRRRRGRGSGRIQPLASRRGRTVESRPTAAVGAPRS